MRWLAPVVLFTMVACGDEAEEAPNCGPELACIEGEFCLGVIPAGGTTGDEEWSCEALPADCADLSAMCIDSPPCIEDWALEVCPSGFTSDSCDGAEAICYL